MTDANEPMTVFDGLPDLIASEGAVLGPTDWFVVEQNRIDEFARATGDHQWIHVDPIRAAAGPYGRTIAHGLLTLSLLPTFMHDLFRVDNVSMAINYGFNKVRFITPVPVDARLRASSVISSVASIGDAVQVTLVTTIEVEGAAKPAAVAESIIRYIA